jgi:hypothetical protein
MKLTAVKSLITLAPEWKQAFQKTVSIWRLTRGKCYKTIAVIFHGKLPQ